MLQARVEQKKNPRQLDKAAAARRRPRFSLSTPQCRIWGVDRIFRSLPLSFLRPLHHLLHERTLASLARRCRRRRRHD